MPRVGNVGLAFPRAACSLLRAHVFEQVLNPSGTQVVDTWAFNAGDLKASPHVDQTYGCIMRIKIVKVCSFSLEKKLGSRTR